MQLVGTAHGNSLENLMMNPTLADLIGGIQSVTLSDEEARRRGTQKSILERKAPPTFDVMVEIISRDEVAVHTDVATTVDSILRGSAPRTELRRRADDGEVAITEADSRRDPSMSTLSARTTGRSDIVDITTRQSAREPNLASDAASWSPASAETTVAPPLGTGSRHRREAVARLSLRRQPEPPRASD